MRIDFKSIPTMDYGRRLLCLPYSILLVVSIVLLSNTVLISSNVACIAEVRISLNGVGQAHLTPSMFINANSSDYTLEVEDSHLSDKTLVDCSFRNTAVSVKLVNSDNATCWSTLYIDDKQDFEVVVNDTLVKCILPLDSIDIAPLVEIIDNCFEFSDFKVTYVDILDSTHTVLSDTLRTYTRIWTFTDPDGTKKVVTSNIFTRRLDPSNIVFPPDITVYHPNDPTDSTITGIPTYMMLDMFDMCEVMVVDELLGPIVQDCDKNLKYFRQRMILDNQTWEIIARDTQTILFRDTILEEIIKPNLSFVDDVHCSASLEIMNFEITNNGIGVIPEEYKSIRVNGLVQVPGDVLSFLVGDTVIVEYSARNDCFDMLESVSDTLIASINNTIVIECPVVTTDVSISLDDLSEKSVWVENLFTGSVSSCSDYSIVGAKVDQSCGGNDLIFDKIITFCQAEVGSTVMIRVTAMDSLGNAASDTCMLMVNIQDKNSPIVNCLLDSDTIYIDSNDSLATISDPLKYLDASDDIGLLSLTGSGSSITRTGSGFMFVSNFITMDSLGVISGNNQFGCMDTGRYRLDLIVSDSSGNKSTCPVDLTVLDSAGICCSFYNVRNVTRLGNYSYFRSCGRVLQE